MMQLQQSDNPEDIDMRTIIYSLLGPEGSLASQKVGTGYEYYLYTDSEMLKLYCEDILPSYSRLKCVYSHA